MSWRAGSPGTGKFLANIAFRVGGVFLIADQERGIAALLSGFDAKQDVIQSAAAAAQFARWSPYLAASGFLDESSNLKGFNPERSPPSATASGTFGVPHQPPEPFRRTRALINIEQFACRYN